MSRASKRSAQRAKGERSSFRPVRGFTLLEVMAAVALLGILYTVLARVAIEGLRAEGESARRLEASLLADSEIADSFTTLEGGVVMPDVGHSEKAEGDFTVALDVALFQPPLEWAVTESEGIRPPLLFAASPLIPGAQALRTVQLTVSWLEGAEERHVSRSMILVDFERVSAIAASLEKNPALPGNTRAPQAPEEPTAPSEQEVP